MNEVPAAGDGPPQGLGRTAAEPAAAEPVGDAGIPAGYTLDISPVTVLGGAAGEPTAPAGKAAERPVRRRTRQAPKERPAAPSATENRRRRTGIAVITAGGVVALAAAPFVVVSPPHVRLLDGAAPSSSEASKTRPEADGKKKPVTHEPAVPQAPVPAPSWQPQHSAPPVPGRPPKVKITPSTTPSSAPSTRPTVRPQQAAPRKEQPTPSAGAASDAPARSDKKPAAHTDAAHTDAAPSTPTPSATATENTQVPHNQAAITANRHANHQPADQTGDTASPTPTPDAAEQTPTPTPTQSSQPDAPQYKVIHGTFVLQPGESVATNRVRLALGTDGNLTLQEHGEVTWETGTHATGTHAVFQGDGNFVLYSADGQTLWSTRTDGHNGAVLVLRGNGDLAIHRHGQTLWSAGVGD